MKKMLIILALVLLLLLAAHNLHVFEDGSWTIGSFGGCLPFAICNL